MRKEGGGGSRAFPSYMTQEKMDQPSFGSRSLLVTYSLAHHNGKITKITECQNQLDNIHRADGLVEKGRAESADL